MLTRDQVYAMLMMRNQGNFFSSSITPNEIVQLISDYELSNDDIDEALKHAAYARKEDVTKLLIMLDKNPSLLLQAGKVTTPGGDIIKRVTIYECCLGAGDSDLAEKVHAYFSKITNGEKERIKQYKRYQRHFENMLKQKPYDLTKLIDLIKLASMDDVIALLNYDETRFSVLRDAIIQFRKDWQPKTIEQSTMHYNYMSLTHAFNLLAAEWDNLYQTSANNYAKINLVWRQLIGFEMRRIPGIDRCIFAQGIFYHHKNGLNRSYQFTNNYQQFFPITDNDDLSNNSLGKNFAIDVLFGSRSPSRCSKRLLQAWFFNRWQDFLNTKQTELNNLCKDLQIPEQSVRKCV